MRVRKMSKNESDIKNRKEIIFLYDAKDCDPNGDPFTGEPRYDESCQKIMVSDVRIKRYIRDFIDFNYSDEENEIITKNEKSKIIFYSSKGETQTVGERREGLSEIVNKNNINDILGKCIDIRLFGAVLAEKGESLNFTGAVQFKNLNRSLNKIELKVFQNTSVMSSKEEKTQGAIATASIVPYALISIIGYVNPKTAQLNKTKEEDIKLMLKSLWDQINTINTRSKSGQTSRLLLIIEYKDTTSKISDLENSIKLEDSKEDNINYRTFDEIVKDLDFQEFYTKIDENKNKIQKIEYYMDQSKEYKELIEFIENLKKKLPDGAVSEIDFRDLKYG